MPEHNFLHKGFTILVKRFRMVTTGLLCVGARPDIPQQLLEQLLETASEAVRSKLATENPALN